MQKTIVIVLLLFTLHSKSYATNYLISGGGRANSMGKAGAALIGNWGTFNNQAATAFETDLSLMSYCENRFGLKEFSAFLAAAVIPTSQGNITTSITYFGLEIYNEQKIGLGYTRRFSDNFSLALQFDLLGLSIPATGVSEHNITFEVGLIYKPTPKLNIGLHIFNPTQIKLSQSTDNTEVPQISRLGLSFKLSENFLIASEIEHSSETDINIKGGLEYYLFDWLAIRSGYYDKPQTCTFGMGFKSKKLMVDLAYQLSNSRNKTPGISIRYYF